MRVTKKHNEIESHSIGNEIPEQKRPKEKSPSIVPSFSHHVGAMASLRDCNRILFLLINTLFFFFFFLTHYIFNNN